jgi:hypothetical protein
VLLGQADGICPVAGIEPMEDVAQVEFDRALADSRGPSDLLIGHPSAEQAEDLLLPLAELGRARRLTEEVVAERRIEVPPAIGDPLERVQ